jgi:hypothetical protein
MSEKAVTTVTLTIFIGFFRGVAEGLLRVGAEQAKAGRKNAGCGGLDGLDLGGG